MRLLTFRIYHHDRSRQPQRFAVRESQAVESIPFGPILAVRNAPDALLGTVLWRGKSIRVIDLSAALGMGPSLLPASTQLLVVRQNRTSTPIAIPVQPLLEEVSAKAVDNIRLVELKEISRIRPLGPRMQPPSTPQQLAG